MYKRNIAIVLSSAFLLSNCASTQYQESTGQYIDSSVITAKVKTHLLENKSVKSLPITVKTYKNTVQLSGFVDNAYQKEKAGQIAATIEGVEQVQNLLVIKKR